MSTTFPPGSVPQGSNLQPPPAASVPPPAASVSDRFNPTPKPGYMTQVFEFVGAKRSPYTDGNGKPQISTKIEIVADPDRESIYTKFIGRAVSSLTVPETVFNKLESSGVNPCECVIPLMFEFKLVPKSGGGMSMIISDVHFSPYQRSLLDKGIQPLSIDPPVKN